MAVVLRPDVRLEAGTAPHDQFDYIRRLGAAVRSAIQARQRLTTELARYEEAGPAGLPALGHVARRAGQELDEARWAVSVARAPRGAELCSQALKQWLTLHVEACDALARAAGTRQPQHVRAALDLLENAKPFAVQFNRVREHLAGRLAA